MEDDGLTRSERQCMSKTLRSSNTSGFRGVSRHKRSKRWTAYITKDQKRIYLGTFKTPEEAARARDAKAIILHGAYARLNEI